MRMDLPRNKFLAEAAVMRGSINLVLAAGAGTVVPLLYTWFVTSQGPHSELESAAVRAFDCSSFFIERDRSEIN